MTTPVPKKGKGRITNADAEFIRKNATVLSHKEIGDAIGRTEEYVKDFILNHPTKWQSDEKDRDLEAKLTIRQELRGSETWKRLKAEFSYEELQYFEEKYVSLMSQFKGDVLPTEETQVFQVIKFELLMSRNLMGRKQAQADIDRLEKMQDDFLDGFNGDPNQMSDEQKAFSINLDTQIRQARNDEATRTNEYVKLQERHDSLMKNLKATRDQRFEKIEREGVDFLGVIRQLSQKDIQEREGRQMELMKLAMAKELERLGRPHTYDDKSQDNPVLCDDTVDLEPLETEQETTDETVVPEGADAG